MHIDLNSCDVWKKREQKCDMILAEFSVLIALRCSRNSKTVHIWICFHWIFIRCMQNAGTWNAEVKSRKLTEKCEERLCCLSSFSIHSTRHLAFKNERKWKWAENDRSDAEAFNFDVSIHFAQTFVDTWFDISFTLHSMLCRLHISHELSTSDGEEMRRTKPKTTWNAWKPLTLKVISKREDCMQWWLLN